MMTECPCCGRVLLNSNNLTKRQKEALDFINDFQASSGYCPSYIEIAEGLGLKSKSNVYRIMQALIARGHVLQDKGQKRAISIIR